MLNIIGYSGTAVTVHDMDCCRVKLQIHTFFTWAINGAEWSVSRPGHFVSGGEFQYPVRYRYCNIDLPVA